MEAASWMRSVLGGLALVSAVGCYSYRPYGMGGYPGMYGQTYGPPAYGAPTYGAQTLPPGTTFAPNDGSLPQGTQILPSAPSTGGSPALGPATTTPFGPSTQAWPPIAPQTANTFVPGGTQPQFDPNRPAPQNTDNFVPDYRDPRETAPSGTFPPSAPVGPSASAAPGGATDFTPNSKPATAPAKPATPSQDMFETPSGFDPNAKNPAPFDSARSTPIPSRGFSRPTTASPGDFPRQVDSFYRSGGAVAGGPVLHDGRVGPIPTRDVSIVETAEGTASPAGAGTTAREIAHVEPARDAGPAHAGPFGHDSAGFRWLQGVVDYDETTRTWNIIYDLVPDADDPLGGSVAFAPSPLFDGLRNDEAVRVEGQLEPAAANGTGKPVYRVVRLSKLVPTKR